MYAALHAHKLQHQAWRQLRRYTQPWLITDLITLGSPLTYADYLLENSLTSFRQAVVARILPTCPPRWKLFMVNSR
jgi:hypothetical protein